MSDPNAPYRPPSALPPADGDDPDRPVAAPPGYGRPARQPVAPRARRDLAAGRASWALLLFAGLELLSGAVAAIHTLGLPLEQVYSRATLDRLAVAGWDVTWITALTGLVVGGCYFVLIIALLVLFAFVRRGSRGGQIAALSLIGLLTLLAGVRTLLGALWTLLALIGTSGGLPTPTGYDYAGFAADAGVAAAGVVLIVLLSVAVAAPRPAGLSAATELD